MQIAKFKIAKVIWRAAWLVPVSVLVMGSLSFADGTVTADPIADQTTINIPELTQANITEASQILSNLPTQLPNLNSTVSYLLSALVPLGILPIEAQGPWHSVDDYRLIGVVTEVSLPIPLTLGPVVLPDTQYDLASDDYESFLFKYDSIVNLRKIRIEVDLGTNLVVGIVPVEADEITPSTNNTFPVPVDGGLG